MGSFSRRAAGVVGAVLAGAGLAAAPSAAQAGPDPQPLTLNVPCNDTAGLIAAINTANAAQAARIRLGKNCTYNLTIPVAQMTTRGPDGLPIITGDIMIDGRGSTIRRTGSAQFRILEVAPGAVLRAVGLGVAGGNAGAQTGGGILNARGRLLLLKSTISGNRADSGAGISNDSGDLRLVISTISNNQTNGGGGGGIYSDGFLLLDRSRVIANQANTAGGGLFTENGSRAVLTRTDLTSNRAVLGGGGGLHNAAGGIVQGSRVRVTFNQAGTGGGGVHNAGRPGSVVFTRSLLQNNMDGDGVPGNDNCHPAGAVSGCRG